MSMQRGPRLGGFLATAPVALHVNACAVQEGQPLHPDQHLQRSGPLRNLIDGPCGSALASPAAPRQSPMRVQAAFGVRDDGP